MLKFYHILKLTLLFIFLFFIGCAILYETTRESHFGYEKLDFIQDTISVYQTVKNFFFDDPYHKTVINRVNNAKLEMETMFTSIQSTISNITTDKEFYNNIFIYMVSKKLDTLDQLVRSTINSNMAFKDLIIIDRNKNVLYKFGDTSFTPDYYPITNAEMIQFSVTGLNYISK